MPLVHKKPSDFVRFLTKPGLEMGAGYIPLTQYMCLNKDNGGNAEISALLTALRAKPIRNRNQTIDEAVGATGINLLWKGQGHPNHFIDCFEFLYQAREQFKGMPGLLGQVYDKYFKDSTAESGLRRMVNDHYFGIDCIGFVANYLCHANLWNAYKPFEISMYDQVFTERVNGVADVTHLNVIIWPNYHIALVDTAYYSESLQAQKKIMIDMCQSSDGSKFGGVNGPQFNKGVCLTEAGSGTVKGYKQFSISEGNPKPPVGGNVYLMKWPGLVCGDS